MLIEIPDWRQGRLARHHDVWNALQRPQPGEGTVCIIGKKVWIEISTWWFVNIHGIGDAYV